MATTVFIEAAVLGQRRPVLSGFSLQVPDPAKGLQYTLGELIGQVVRMEVEAFHLRQESSRLAVVLSSEEIAQQAETGRILSGEREFLQDVDPETAVHTALLAFTDGLYFVFLNGSQVNDLSALLDLQEGSSLRFVRLTALAGG